MKYIFSSIIYTYITSLYLMENNHDRVKFEGYAGNVDEISQVLHNLNTDGWKKIK